MTAQVVTLPVVYQQPPSRVERARDRLSEAHCWLLSQTVYRVPVVIIRRSELGRREKDAFELGRDCQRYLRS